jgi:hypothetical protein
MFSSQPSQNRNEKEGIYILEFAYNEIKKQGLTLTLL